MSFPKGRWWARAGVWMANFGMAITRREFRVFVHPTAQILATAKEHGLKPAIDLPGVFWQIAAMQRVA